MGHKKKGTQSFQALSCEHHHINASYTREQVYCPCFILEQTGAQEQTAGQTEAATLTHCLLTHPRTTLAKQSPTKETEGDAKYLTIHFHNTSTENRTENENKCINALSTNVSQIMKVFLSISGFE